MIAFIIIGAVILVLLAILFLPISVGVTFRDSFIIKIRFAGIKLYEIDTDKEKTEKPTDEPEGKEKKPKAEKPSFFDDLKKKYGFTGAVKEILRFAEDLLTHIKRLLRHIIINKVQLNLTVAADDAATTALEYGAICAAAYPVLALLSGVAKIKYKAININSDFNSMEPKFDFALNVKTRIFFLGVTAWGAYKEYTKFRERLEDNERK